ncbi:MAG: PolC-type DNA polymerase III [Bacilli bacterium]
MEENLEVLLKKIAIDEKYYSDFDGAKLKNIIVHQNDQSLTIILETNQVLEASLYFLMEELLCTAFNTKVRLQIETISNNSDLIPTYFKETLEKIKPSLVVAPMFVDRLKLQDDSYQIEALNKAEYRQIHEVLTEINYWYTCYGFKEELTAIINEDKRTEVVNDILTSRESIPVLKPLSSNDSNSKESVKKDTVYRKAAKEDNPNCILGRTIKDTPVKISGIIGEDNSITIECQIFGVDYFESKTSDFKIITLKVTDFSDSIYCKVFSREADEYARLCKVLKTGTWVMIRGYTKNDTYAKEIVLNARDIIKLDKDDTNLQDTSEIKRVELHTHSLNSQMDGLVSAKALVKQAIKWGHKAIAITDHQGAQSFPDVYHEVRDYNKGKEECDKFKAIYGTELIMIDDSVDIVLRGTELPLMETTYVVFDLETTGFNAGGADSIIEVGAVKICNGEIIDRFDELINPGCNLSSKITEVTNITDSMLKDKDTEENVIKRFVTWFGNSPMVAHNAKFDTSFLSSAYHKYNLGEFTNCVIDTLKLSQTLDSNFARHNLTALMKRYDIPWDETAHHRADYDAEGTALVFNKMLKKVLANNLYLISDLNKLVTKDEIYKYGTSHHINILVKNKTGLKNLFKLISYANTKYLYKFPRIPRSEVESLREGLLIGSGCYESEVFKEARTKDKEELTNIISFYDYVEVQPPECYGHLLELHDFGSQEELLSNIKKVIEATHAAGKIIVATGDVHHMKREDKIYREIIVNQKVPGGGRHPLARKGITSIPSCHFRTTDEMLNDFAFLDKDLREEIVITNPNKIADLVDIIEVIIETGGIPFSPKIKDSVQTVKDLVYTKASSMYGESLPALISNRIEHELSGIINSGFDVIYLIAQKLVKHSNDDGYLVGSRGSVGSSFVATMMGITEVNPLPAHYLCYNCKYSEFNDNNDIAYGKSYPSGYDLPDKICPKCGKPLGKEGQDMPFATFLGFNADKVPDIDLNFSGEYQWKAHEYTKELFGVDNVYRAGTIGTVADKTAFGYVKGYCEEKGIANMRTAEVERIALGCTGVKRTTGQHPGGIVVIPEYMDVFDFTPFQYPADDPNSLWKTTHFDYHSIEEDVLKLDILGHDDPTILRMLQDLSGIDVTTLPFDDKEVFSLLCSPNAMGVTAEEIMCPTGTLGLPELGTKFVIQLLVDTQPKTFSELVKISGLSHGTDVWAGNASELIKNKVVPFKDVIGCRDDIMVNLTNWGMEPKEAFKIMEFVRKGKPTKMPEEWKKWETKMKEASVPEWYIDSCHKIKYMFPKAHACAYVMSALRIAWFKVHKPLLYYAAYFSIRVNDFDIETMIKGYEAIKTKLEVLMEKGYDASNKETNIIESLKIALEATARGITFSPINILKSDAKRFILDEEHENSLIPPFGTLEGLGETAATSIVNEREIKYFLSIEDLQKRGKVSATIIGKMRAMGILNDLPESSQMTLF